MKEKLAKLTFGLPAAGKTSYIRDNHILDTHVLVCADTIKEGLPHYDKTQAHLVHQESVELAEDEINELADTGVNIIMDGGGINNNYTLRIISMLKSKGYTVALIHINTPLDVCLKRNRVRMDNGERFVPVDNILAKSEKLKECLKKLTKVVDEVITINR